jgi:hypothetical protein
MLIKQHKYSLQVHQTQAQPLINHTVMLSDKYLWPVPELTLVHEAYKLALFQKPVTDMVHSYIGHKPLSSYDKSGFDVTHGLCIGLASTYVD